MRNSSDFPARGKVIEASAERIVFAPTGTSYLLHLSPAGPYAGPLNVPVSGVVRVRARKVYTVPSGGSFIQPIVGEPRIVQGRVVWLSETQLLLRAGTHVLVDLPSDDAAVELGDGEIAVGSMVNVVALPNASFAELLPAKT